ncbi:phosphatase PAP2 family protein [Rhodobacter maris]|uniref:Undecaprenyl-diphosphatase n=1 Tax=Rhodobacter maris TaxID=446682 RepID=A0A285THX2_9RHOB|nr:phosphatase PAP2 family protein [Rhodobacter maris]SOC21567.1 undecaprenyl-diphosphatase [Rhodobacter maris]
MDAAITHCINSLAGQVPLVDGAMIALTQAGIPLMVAIVALHWWGRDDRRHAALCAGLAFLLGLAINQALLLEIHRLRPYETGVTRLLIAPSADWSFPSDHATAAFAIAVSFALQALPRRALAFLAVAVLVSLSRVYVGTHYLGDVSGGAATGALAALLVRMTWREGNRLDRLATSLL